MPWAKTLYMHPDLFNFAQLCKSFISKHNSEHKHTSQRSRHFTTKTVSPNTFWMLINTIWECSEKDVSTFPQKCTKRRVTVQAITCTLPSQHTSGRDCFHLLTPTKQFTNYIIIESNQLVENPSKNLCKFVWPYILAYPCTYLCMRCTRK